MYINVWQLRQSLIILLCFIALWILSTSHRFSDLTDSGKNCLHAANIEVFNSKMPTKSHVLYKMQGDSIPFNLIFLKVLLFFILKKNLKTP